MRRILEIRLTVVVAAAGLLAQSASCRREEGFDQNTTSRAQNVDEVECRENADCPSGNPCEVPVCVAGSCALAPLDGNACDDGDACTLGDRCEAGECIGEAPKPPPAGQCEREASLYCVDGQWRYERKQAGSPCDDGSACTLDDSCDEEGQCIGIAVEAPAPAVCEESSSLYCDENGSWRYRAAEGRPCDDGVSCTDFDQCNGNAECVGTPRALPSPDQCDDTTSLECVQGAWVYGTSPGAACDDANPCTTNDQCDASGACAGDAVTCNEPPLCHAPVITGCTADGECEYLPTPGAACDDGDICTSGDRCSAQLSCSGDAAPTLGVGAACGPVEVGGGTWHSCALASAHGDAVMQCWGYNRRGQLGSPGASDPDAAVDVNALNAGPAIAQIAGGNNHTCALRVDGKVMCWGDGGFLGTSSPVGTNSPVQVELLDDAVAIAAGARHTCALRQNGRIRCWGDNSDGQLGTGDTSWGWAPRNVQEITQGAALGAGRNHTCAITTDDLLYCWGANTSGQSAPSSGASSILSPAEIDAPAGLAQVVGGAEHSCLLSGSGQAWCWGGPEGLGLGSDAPAGQPLTLIGGGAPWTSIASTDFATCGLGLAQDAWCWGAANEFRMGDGSGPGDYPNPVEVGLSQITALGGGRAHMCAMRSDRSLWCWGDDSRGQLGQGAAGSTAPSPQRITP